MRFGPSWAADYAEAQARARFRREEALNRVIETRNPRIRPTEKYLRGPLPSWSPEFGSFADYLEYRATRSMGKYDPNVKYR